MASLNSSRGSHGGDVKWEAAAPAVMCNGNWESAASECHGHGDGGRLIGVVGVAGCN